MTALDDAGISWTGGLPASERMAMSFSYTTRVLGNCLLVTSKGAPDSSQAFFEYIKRSVLKAANKGLPHVIFDESEAVLMLDIYDTVLMSDRLDREGLQSLAIKVAVVCRPSDLPMCKYFERSLRNRGFNIMMFEEMGKAKQWLPDVP